MSSPTLTESQPRFAIIGAGITGLVLALGLRKNGFTNVTVFDAEPHTDARPGDWTILLHWGLPVMMSLLPDSLTEARLAELAMCNPHVNGDPVTETLPAYNGMTGELAFSVPCKGSIRVTRHKLRRALAAMLAEEDQAGVRWGKKLESLDQRDDGSLGLLFEDGSSFDADHVVGADGVSSKVRELLFAHDPERAKTVNTDLTFAMARVKYGDAKMVQSVLDVTPLTALCFFAGAVGGMGILDAPDANDISGWTAFWVRIWAGGKTNMRGKEAIDYVKSVTKGTWAPYQQMVDATPDDSSCSATQMKYWIPTKWDNKGGRVTLLGDAAHPILPYRGQGFQHAILDAESYVKAHVALRQDPTALQKTMDALDADTVSRGSAAVEQTLSEAQKAFAEDRRETMDMATKGLSR